jgi:uncharacterized membrane protein YoaK (UPF0700 family)
VIAVVLAGVAGFVDAALFVAMDLFTAHMSGNSDRMGVYIGRGLFLRAVPSLFAIVLFVAAVAAGTLVMEVLGRRGVGSPAAGVLGLEAVLLGAIAIIGPVVAVDGRLPVRHEAAYYAMASLAVVAMGLQTSALQRVSGHTVRTTFVSGMLTAFADEVVGYALTRRSGRHGDAGDYVQGELGIRGGRASLGRIRFMAAIWAAYAGSAIAGSYFEVRWSLGALVVPAVVLGVVIAFDLSRPVTPA